MSFFWYTVGLSQGMNHAENEHLPFWFRVLFAIVLGYLLICLWLNYTKSERADKERRMKQKEEAINHYNYLDLTDAQCKILEAKITKHD